MSKKEMVLQSITWKIEAATENLNHAIERIQREIGTENPKMINSITIQHAAMDIAESQERLRMLNEELQMLEFLTEE